ncbi:MAG: hypothetical protein, partial [Olavius algarvensis Gamma 1 endosymbiont]
SEYSSPPPRPLPSTWPYRNPMNGSSRSSPSTSSAARQGSAKREAG